jgi:predicted  nucleic acid-binding Zn-ribbon protein
MSQALVIEVDVLKRNVSSLIEHFHAVNRELETAKKTFEQNNETIARLQADVEQSKADADAKAKAKAK